MKRRGLQCRAICVFSSSLACWVGAGAAKTQMPEFTVRSQFEQIMARRFSDTCETVAFDTAGGNWHLHALIAQFGDRGIHARTLAGRYAPTHPLSFDRHIEDFASKHGFSVSPESQALCAAAKTEAF